VLIHDAHTHSPLPVVSRLPAGWAVPGWRKMVSAARLLPSFAPWIANSKSFLDRTEVARETTLSVRRAACVSPKAVPMDAPLARAGAEPGGDRKFGTRSSMAF
jgi:hypothetical protein